MLNICIQTDEVQSAKKWAILNVLKRQNDKCLLHKDLRILMGVSSLRQVLPPLFLSCSAVNPISKTSRTIRETIQLYIYYVSLCKQLLTKEGGWAVFSKTVLFEGLSVYIGVVVLNGNVPAQKKPSTDAQKISGIDPLQVINFCGILLKSTRRKIMKHKYSIRDEYIYAFIKYRYNMSEHCTKLIIKRQFPKLFKNQKELDNCIKYLEELKLIKVVNVVVAEDHVKHVVTPLILTSGVRTQSDKLLGTKLCKEYD